ERVVTAEYDEVGAPPVLGRAASYLYLDTGNGPRPYGLRFEWAPGAVAVVSHQLDVAQQAQLVEVAQSLRTDVDSPVQFAFTVSQPAGLQLAQAQPFTAGEEGGASQLWFAADPGPVALPLDGTRSYVVVSAGYSSVEPPVQNATVGGRPAYVLDEADYY